MATNELHEYLRVAGGVSSHVMFAELQRLRRHKSPWEGVPDTLEAFDAGLEELRSRGLAEQLSNGAWLWLPAKRVQVCEPKTERMLFA